MKRWRWKSRLVSWLVGFLVGLLVVFVVHTLWNLFTVRRADKHDASVARVSVGCQDEHFASPEEILRALGSTEVGVRREMFRRLSLSPGASANFYDFARDAAYPARAEDSKLVYVNLDETPGDEALISFVRWENPVAVVLQKVECGWRIVKVLSAWLRFEDTPYRDWIELIPLFRKDQHAILLRESDGDETHYFRSVNVMRLTGGWLERVAQFTEESITPLEGYKGADWPEVKSRETCRYQFKPETATDEAGISLEFNDEAVKYQGVAPSRVYWGESDGAWHSARAHWRNRTFTTVKTLGTRSEELSWSAARGVFADVECQH